MSESFDLIIIGSGLAGLSTAFYASQKSKKSIALLTKEFKTEASSFLAQGGIAVALNKEDSIEKHFNDTMRAGHYLNNKKVVKILTKNAPKQIKELIDLGLNFDEGFALEGMHSIARVMHINGDKTGLNLSNFMLKLCKENDVKIIKAELIEMIAKNNELNALIVKENKEENIYFGNAFVLATGGYSGLWLNSTNPFALGHAISKAKKINAKLMDLELEQFHPTTFKYSSKEKTFNFLISEAVRGEKAILVNEKGERITKELKEKELAGRDIISRIIFEETMKGKKIYIDCNNKPIDFWKKKFPTIFNKLKEFNYVMGKDLIPVECAAHYSIGGIKTNEKTMTSIKRLFAVGECSCNGLHGANRLASNSLTECIVFGKIAALNAIKLSKQTKKIELMKKKEENNENTNKEMQQKLKQILWEKVGIKRNELKLREALIEIKKIRKNLTNKELIEEALLSELITLSALKRKNSIGVHYREDSKDKPKELKHTII